MCSNNYLKSINVKDKNLYKLMAHIQLYKSVKYTWWTYLTMLDDIGLFECSLDETWKHVGWYWIILMFLGWNMKTCWMELDYLNILWMKHENMLDGVGLFEHSLDETWKHVELDNMDEIELCQREHIYGWWIG
jgi:hypothetical protein